MACHTPAAIAAPKDPPESSQSLSSAFDEGLFSLNAFLAASTVSLEISASGTGTAIHSRLSFTARSDFFLYTLPLGVSSATWRVVTFSLLVWASPSGVTSARGLYLSRGLLISSHELTATRSLEAIQGHNSGGRSDPAY